MSTASGMFKRLAWMIGIWSASVATLGVISFVLRIWLKRA
jgi:uncharacterized protein DUF2474